MLTVERCEAIMDDKRKMLNAGVCAWANVDGFPWWPTKIVLRDSVPIELRRNLAPSTGDSRVVQFFGDRNRVEVVSLRSLEEYVSMMHLARSPAPPRQRFDVMRACEEANIYIRTKGVSYQHVALSNELAKKNRGPSPGAPFTRQPRARVQHPPHARGPQPVSPRSRARAANAPHPNAQHQNAHHPNTQHPNVQQHPNSQQHPNAQHPNVQQHPNSQHPNSPHPNAQHPNSPHPNSPHLNVPHPNAQHRNAPHPNSRFAMRDSPNAHSAQPFQPVPSRAVQTPPGYATENRRHSEPVQRPQLISAPPVPCARTPTTPASVNHRGAGAGAGAGPALKRRRSEGGSDTRAPVKAETAAVDAGGESEALLAGLRAVGAAMTDVLPRVRARLERHAMLEAEEGALKRRIAALRSEEAVVSESVQLLKSVATQEEKVEAHRRRIAEDLKGAIEESSRKNKALERKFKELEESKAATKRNLDEMEEGFDEIRAARRKVRAEVDELESAKRVKAEELRQLKDEIESVNKERASMQAGGGQASG